MGDVKFVELSKNLANSGEEKEIAMIEEEKCDLKRSKKVDGGGGTVPEIVKAQEIPIISTIKLLQKTIKRPFLLKKHWNYVKRMRFSELFRKASSSCASS